MNKEDNTKNIPGMDAQITLSGITIASQDGLMQHVNDSAVHITDEERSKWNASAGSVAGDVVTSIGGRTGDFLLGDGLNITLDEDNHASLELSDNIVFRNAPFMSSLTVSNNFKINRKQSGITESFPILSFDGDISNPIIHVKGVTYVYNRLYATADLFLWNTPVILRDGKYWDSKVTSTKLPQNIESPWTFNDATTFNGAVFANASFCNSTGIYQTTTGKSIRIGDTSGTPNTGYFVYNNNPVNGMCLTAVAYNASGIGETAVLYIDNLCPSGYGFVVRSGTLSSFNGTTTFNASTVFNGDVVRQTKAAPGATDVMNMEMVKTLINTFAIANGLTPLA